MSASCSDAVRSDTSIRAETPGRLSVSILIRTLARHADGWRLCVGGGIVADSDPSREIAETWEKVAVFGEVFSPERLGAGG